MNLYELAHHPESFAERDSWKGIGYMSSNHTNNKQFEMLALVSLPHCAYNHEDENEFRMHLLFVYFATTPEKDWPV